MYFYQLICFSLYLSTVYTRSDYFELSVVHFNDFHARFDQTNPDGGTCKEEKECIGGFSRLYTQISVLLKNKPKSLLLNAGDSFQGTLWYNIGKYNVTQEFMNKLPIDATAVGNHEFEDGIDGLVPYIKALKHPTIVSNIDDSLEPNFQNIYSKSIIVERDGKKIGIVGVTTKDCPALANTGRLKFHDESSSVNAEADRLAEQGVFAIIVLSHAGYQVDQIIAQNASKKINLIVGGHSHTFLYTGDNPPGPDTVEGPYPTIVKSKFGHQVLVTQASAYSKYLGNITVFFNDQGEIVKYSGSPIYLDHSIPQDDGINAALKPWKELVDSQGNVVLGSTAVTLSRNCTNYECTLGNVIADAYVYQYTKSAPKGWWTEAAIGLLSSGSIRTNLEIGNITYADLFTSQPFANTVDFVQVEGKYLRELLEDSTKNYKPGVYTTLNFIQVSGLHVVYDFTKPEGEHIISFKARCDNCTIPVYEDVVPSKLYNVAVCSYMTNRGNGFDAFADNLKNKRVGEVDIIVLIDYLKHKSPIITEESGRITVYETTLN